MSNDVVPDQINPDQINPDQINPDQIKPDQINPDQVTPYQISIEDEGRLLANAVVSADAEHHLLRATLHVEAGQLPASTRTRLVDALLDSSDATPGTRLSVAFPAGDGEILTRIRQRCTQVEVRSAGASCMLTGNVPTN